MNVGDEIRKLKQKVDLLDPKEEKIGIPGSLFPIIRSGASLTFSYFIEYNKFLFVGSP